MGPFSDGSISSKRSSYSNAQLGKALQECSNEATQKMSTMAPSSTMRAEKEAAKKQQQRADSTPVPKHHQAQGTALTPSSNPAQNQRTDAQRIRDRERNWSKVGTDRKRIFEESMVVYF
jgi:hypothetical protein